MDDLEHTLTGLEARSVEELLTQLSERQSLRARGEPVRLPWVTLSLRSGREIQGYLLELREDGRGHRSVVLHAAGTDPRRPEPDVAFVRLEAIEAVIVHDLPSLSHPPPGTPPPPTRLELKRRLSEWQSSLSASLGTPLELTVDWERLPFESEATSALAALGSRTVSVLEELAREPLGAQALRERVRKLRFAVGTGPQAHMEGQELLLITPVAATGWMSREELRGAIERLL